MLMKKQSCYRLIFYLCLLTFVLFACTKDLETEVNENNNQVYNSFVGLKGESSDYYKPFLEVDNIFHIMISNDEDFTHLISVYTNDGNTMFFGEDYDFSNFTDPIFINCLKNIEGVYKTI